MGSEVSVFHITRESEGVQQLISNKS